MSTHKQNKSLLSRLRTAVNKVRLLLSSTILSHTCNAVTMLRRGTLPQRRVSFNDRQGLVLCSEETDSGDSASSSPCLQRTLSCPSSDDDIDRRAEIFIANFRRQLQMERQISLQLRYCRQRSSESMSPWCVLLTWVCVFDLVWSTWCWRTLFVFFLAKSLQFWWSQCICVWSSSTKGFAIRIDGRRRRSKNNVNFSFFFWVIWRGQAPEGEFLRSQVGAVELVFFFIMGCLH